MKGNMWKYLATFTLIIIITKQTSSNSIGRVPDDQLYDDYDYPEDDIENKQHASGINDLSNKNGLTTSRPRTSSLATHVNSTDEEAPLILTAGVSQVYSKYSKNLYKDEKAMKLLQERSGEALPPTNCSQYKMLTSQPALLPVVTIPKCCNVGENYYFNDTTRGCAPAGAPFEFDLIHAVFYEGCIEDQELNVSYKIEQRSPCAGGVLYNEVYGDFLYVLSNGSLLRVSDDWESYDISDEYCLDMTFDPAGDETKFVLSAISCHDVYGGVIHVSQIQGMICAVLMMVSVPCLIAVAAIYFFIPNLNDLHGKALGLHSICLAAGFLLLALIQLTEYREGPTGYVIQYFILAAFFWMLLMVMDIAVEVWHYLPNGMEMAAAKENMRLTSYTLVAQGMPLIFVFLTYYEGYPGLPSYYFRANESGEMASQKYFIPVVTVILTFSLVIAIVTEFGYAKLNTLNELSFLKRLTDRFSRQTSRVSQSTMQRQISAKINNLDPVKIEKVATMKKSTNILLAVMIINWILEIISFYFTSSRISPILFLDVINALQGVVIFMLFVCLPGPMNIIRKYFKDKYHMADQSKEKELKEIREILLQNGTSNGPEVTGNNRRSI